MVKKYWKYGFLILGVIIVLYSLTTNITESCNTFDENDEMTYFYTKGIDSIHNQICFVVSLIAILISLFLNKILGLILNSILILLGSVLLLFIIEISTAGWGRPCGTSITSNFNIMILGYILINTFSYINLILKQKKKKTTDLLDNL